MGANMKQYKIMIVEDESLVAADIQIHLEKMGYDVCSLADSGEEAVEQARLHQPDLVLMDIVLHGSMDGTQAAEELRKHINVPIVFLTAHADRQMLDRAKNCEPYGYLIKPFNPAELRATIEMALHKSAVEAKANKDVENYCARLRKVLSDLTVTEARERRHIADTLDYHIGQNLCVSRMNMEKIRNMNNEPALVQSVEEVSEYLSDVIENVQKLTVYLSPPSLALLGLEAALKEVSYEVGRKYGVSVDFEDDGRRKPISEEAADLLFDAARELVVSAARNTTNDKIKLCVLLEGDFVRVDVEADGLEIDFSETDDSPDGAEELRVFGIRERLAHMGGSLEINRSNSKGRRASLFAPLNYKSNGTKASNSFNVLG